jgi:hypothetical protein
MVDARHGAGLEWGRWVMLIAAILVGLATMPAQAERRVALVIGNGAYDALGKLPNPLNDANDIAAALTGLGFEVKEGENVDEDHFAELLDQFASLARGADVALFFYAGHGIQFQNENFLIPVDAKLKTRLALKRETLALSDVAEAMRGARVSLIFIDACRSFPLEGTFFGDAVERIIPANGLAPVEPGPNTFIGFSASAGQTAADGFSRNSPFASAMLEFLPRDGLGVADMFTAVSNQVRDATGGAQVPQSWANLSRPLALVAPKSLTTVDAGPSEEERLYLLAREVGTAAAFRSFLARFPGGFFAELAKEELARLDASNSPPPDEQPGPEPSAEPPAPEPEPVAPAIDVAALVARCDKLAADPYDRDRTVVGVAIDDLEPVAAIDACRAAIDEAGETVPARLLYQLGRAHQAAGDLDAAMKSYEAAEAGSAEAKSAIAAILRDGKNGSLNLERAIDLFATAASEGSVTAMTAYGQINSSGEGGVSKDEERAADWYKRAAELDYPPAMHLLANAYRDGRGVAKNMQRAMQLYDRARARGLPNSAYNLAWLLDVADGVSRNSRQSAQYFLEALGSKNPVFVTFLQRDGKQLSDETRRAVQQALKDKGYYQGAVDGAFGPGTNRAIAAAGGQS